MKTLLGTRPTAPAHDVAGRQTTRAQFRAEWTALRAWLRGATNPRVDAPLYVHGAKSAARKSWRARAAV